MHIILCDDDPLYLDSLNQKILIWARERGIQNGLFIKPFQSSEDLLDAWGNGMTIDAVFLDIEIPGEVSGMELAKKIHEMDEYVPIVFVTNYEEYACEGYSVNAVRYLKKPVSQEDVTICMDICWRRWESSQEHFISITAGAQSVHVATRSILYAETVTHVLRIFTMEGEYPYEIRSTLDELGHKLPAEEFVRCHKSYLVNLRYIRKCKNSLIYLSSGIQIPIGRKYASIFTAQLQKFNQGGSRYVDHH